VYLAAAAPAAAIASICAATVWTGPNVWPRLLVQHRALGVVHVVAGDREHQHGRAGAEEQDGRRRAPDRLRPPPEALGSSTRGA